MFQNLAVRFRLLACGLLALVALHLGPQTAEAAVTDLFTSAAVSTGLEGWTADVGGTLAIAVGVAFALMAVFGALALIRRVATRGVR